MIKSSILEQDYSGVEEHASQWAKIKDGSEGLRKILEVITKPKGTALIFSHDDPDGITSGLIFKRMLQKKGWNTKSYFPEGFALQQHQFDKALAETNDASIVFMLDKGTLDYYDNFAANLPVYLIDHHPSPKTPQKCIFFNPSVPAYTWCSTSILAHGIAALADTADDFDSFLCLMGLKGDWAIEPVKSIISDFVKPYFVKYAQKFANLLSIVDEPPTMFDAEQRTNTCLLSSVTEFVHATGGGGFSYFYHDRNELLKNLDHAALIAEALDSLADRVEELKKIKSLKDFTNLLPEAQRGSLNLIFGYFREDWKSANAILDSSAKILKLKETSIYLFVGPKVPLLPMIGSIKLFELKQNAADTYAQIIMVSSVSADYTHVSVRGSADQVHSGKICGELQDSLREIYPHCKDKISGGGHPKAAECTIKTDQVTFLNVLTRLTEVLTEMSNLDSLATSSQLNEVQKARANKLGLDYLEK